MKRSIYFYVDGAGDGEELIAGEMLLGVIDFSGDAVGAGIIVVVGGGGVIGVGVP